MGNSIGAAHDPSVRRKTRATSPRFAGEESPLLIGTRLRLYPCSRR